MAKELVRWGDVAMFEAAPMPTTTPKVHLISMTPDPLGALAAAAKMYKGEVVRSLAEVTDEERLSYFDDLTKTTLNAAFETIDFHFLIEGVTRGFTHQLVRQRTAVYFQESTRFAVVDDLVGSRVGLPPSLFGTEPHSVTKDRLAAEGVGVEGNLSDEELQRALWDRAILESENAYKLLVDLGMPAEDARGLLPTNLLTFVHYKTNLRNLVDVAGVRLCTQAQFEWRYVFSQIAEAIRNAKVKIPTHGFHVSDERSVSVSKPDGSNYVEFPVYMASQISDRLFRPVCYQTGRCQFRASFDRHCDIRDRVEANYRVGRESSEWGGSHHNDAPQESGPLGDKVMYYADGITPMHIQGIAPAEWLLDPSAARS